MRSFPKNHGSAKILFTFLRRPATIGPAFAVEVILRADLRPGPRLLMHHSVDNPHPTFDELIDRARRGSATSLGTLLQECRGYLLVIANERLDAHIQAKLGGSDLVQQSLMHAHRDFVNFRGRSQGELLAWLQSILMNEVARAKRDYMFTAKRDVMREVALGHQDGLQSGGSWLPADTETPSKLAVAGEDDIRLQQAIQRLNAPFRQVIELRNHRLLTFAEIGAQMDISEERARRLWARAIERLRWSLTDDETDRR